MRIRLIGLSAALLLLLMACGRTPATPTAAAVSAGTTQTATAPATLAQATPDLPTPTSVPLPTPVPLAAIVNGTPITLAEFDSALVQYREWYGDRGPDNRDIRAYTLETLITQTLIDQAAARMGLDVTPETVEAAINEAIAETGGREAFGVWLSASGLDEAAFRARVTSELRTQAVIGAVTAAVPTTAEFIRARYIQVDSAETAAQIQAELAAGADFATLVALYSLEPTKAETQGDLGFFARGTLLVPEVEAAAFALQPRQTSETINVTRDDGSQTYYIVQTLAREPFRALGAEQRASLAAAAFEAWLAAERAAATIEYQIGFD